ncbi:hypothetical protein D1AOALGA4SA_10920 [Olavius algarvensis Delta 1 endosymbiont]|nr:hypothetical protein D1AOALGA4SA_10920 [Olavius algarvensis Delta 1 endosymbiont]
MRKMFLGFFVNPWHTGVCEDNVQRQLFSSTIDGDKIDRAKRYLKSSIFNLQSSIVNIQFPDKSGFTLRCNRLSLSGLG